MYSPPNTNHALRKSGMILGIIVCAFYILSYFPTIVAVLILSGLASFILKPIVYYLEYRMGIRRWIAITVVFATLGISFLASALVLLPVLLERAQTLYATFRNFPFEQALQKAAQDFSVSLPFVDANTIVVKVHSVLAGFQKDSEIFLNNLASSSLSLILVPFLTYFILADGDRVMKRLIEHVPNNYFEMTLNVLYKIKRDLRGYLKGWILDSLFVGVLSICGYFLIKIDFAIIIGIIAGIANLIPYFGPIGGAIPAVFISLMQYGDFQKLPDIVLLTVFIQLLDNVLIQPLCFAKTVDMHPVTVILVLLIGNTLMGIVGMLLAIPLATIFKASALETYWGLKHYRITT